MPANQEHVHLAWTLWSDLRFIPTHGEFCSLVKPIAIFARSCLVDLKRVFLPIPAMPVPPDGQVLFSDVLKTHTAWVKASKEIELKTLHAQHVGHELACKQEEGQSVNSYVLKMKSYIDNLERLGHAMTQNLVVSLILVCLRKEYDSFVKNYNMHSMGKTVTELHAMLKLHEKNLPRKDDAPALHAIRAGRVQKNQKKKPHKAAKGNQGKGKAKMGYEPVAGPPCAPKPKNPPTPRRIIMNNLVYFNAISRDDIYEINLSSNTNDSFMYAISNKRAKLNLNSTLLWHCRLGHISKKRIEKLQHDGLLNSTDIMSFEKCVSCMFGKMARKPYSHQVERAKDLLGLIHTDEVENQLGKTIKLLRFDRGGEYTSQEFLDHLKEHGIITYRTPPYPPQHNGYPKETMGYSFYYPPENKVFVSRNAKFFENSLITQATSGSLEDLEIIKEEYTHPFIDTSLNHEEDDQEIDEPQSDINPIRKSSRTYRTPDQMCLHVDAEEHELGDLGDPTNYKAALLDPNSDKWLDAMNVEMQSMKDNKVWDLFDLLPNYKIVGSK
uniref:Uncharacterized protein n=1 Tax=Tanacetum cinerariifolium TaxID=118510 RepID=A0A699GNM0_TANCI|nr:hypothetical protein [Tanacetum cinerariifolium]